MSYDYAPLLATADRLLAQFGVVGTLTATEPDYDPAVRAATAVRLEDSRGSNVAGGVGVDHPYAQFIVNAAAIPLEGETLTLGAEAFALARVEPIKPGATVLAYLAQARG